MCAVSVPEGSKMTDFRLCFAVALICFVSYVSSHSWIACSDYAEKNGGDWDSSKCRGYPRDADKYAQKDSFGQDRGFDFKPSSNTAACKTALTSGSYSSAYPKAVYFPGQQVILAHPMKNHGADAACTNVYIPDNGNALYRGKQGENVDTYETLSYYKQFLVADLGKSPVGAANSQSSKYPKPGYQNAPNFCQNTDKSMGTYSFNVPSNLEPGFYTFVWRWSFNSADDLYSTCFDVVIANNRAHRDSILSSQGITNLDVPCGGSTSNLGTGSSVGCGNGGTQPTPSTSTGATTTTTAATTTTTPATPPTPGPDGSRRVPTMVFQMSGEIPLGSPANGVTRRYISVHFDCPDVEASFFNARLIRSHNHENGGRKKRHLAVHYDLIQEGFTQLSSGKIYFTVTFPVACDIITSPPIATLQSDE